MNFSFYCLTTASSHFLSDPCFIKGQFLGLSIPLPLLGNNSVKTFLQKRNAAGVVSYAVRATKSSPINFSSHTENIKGLNLAAVIYTTVQVPRPLL
jgi:hypothetical protein